MKLVLISAVTVFLVFGAMAPAYAQHDQQEKPAEKQQGKQQQGAQRPEQGAQRPAQQQAKPAQQPQQRAQQQQQAKPAHQQQQRAQQQQQAKPAQQPQQRAQQQQQAKPARQQQQQAQQQQARGYPVQLRTQQQARGWQQQRGWLQQGGWQEHGTWQQHRAQQWGNEHRTWAQRGGYGGYYIPQDRFQLYFGSQHWFRIRTLPVIYMGYPRFQYGGFSFMFVDPWPEFWAEDWYASDDVYVDYDDGYYLYNRRHPGVGIAITVVM